MLTQRAGFQRLGIRIPLRTWLGDGSMLTGELVLVDVQVLRVKTGTPAGTLTAKDLRVFEEGVPQEIRQFSRDEFPLSVASCST
jgi:hypothetical protein